MHNLLRSLSIYRSHLSVVTATKVLSILAVIVSLFMGAILLDRSQTEAAISNPSLTTTAYQSINPDTQASLLTISESETESAKTKHGFTHTTPLFMASARSQSGLTPIYRVYNPKSGDFMVTQWKKERDTAEAKYGYRYEGISFYASAKKTPHTTPLYKFLKGSLHRYAVTSQDANALLRDGWKKEGIAFYVQSLQDTAVVTVPTPPVKPQPTPAPATPTAENTVTGDMVQWSTLAGPNDTLHTVLQKPALRGKILKLPAGIFEVSNYQNPYVAINVPADVKGVVGSGKDTIIRMKPYTSTYGNTVPAQHEGGTNQLYIIRMNDGTQPQILSDFWLQGTEQGHLYNGIMIGKSKPGTTAKNLLITGIPGDYHENPGETFGLTYWHGNNSITRNIEVDGTRWTGDSYATRKQGAVVGASGLSFSMHDHAKVYDSYIHDHRYGMPTFWKSNYGQTWNLRSIRNRIGINHEYSFSTVHHQPVMHSTNTRRHVNFLANDRDGKLTIIGATNDEWINTTTSGSIGKGKNMLILTSYDYRSKNDNSIVTPPTVLLDDGKTKAPYVWAH